MKTNLMKQSLSKISSLRSKGSLDRLDLERGHFKKSTRTSHLAKSVEIASFRSEKKTRTVLF